MSSTPPNIERLRQGDEQAWGDVQREYTGRLLRYVGKRVEDHQAQEDILQETFLGALRGIQAYDPRYQFEQYLFGICRNRTIDHLRRRAIRGVGGEEEDSIAMLERVAVDEGTPSQVFGLRDLGERGSDLLGEALITFLDEAFLGGEWQRLQVVELLLGQGERNSHVARELGIADESAVAGIKFRALKRLAHLAGQAQGGHLKDEISQAVSEGRMDLDLAQTWKRVSASCPHRYWWARLAQGPVEEGLRDYLRFHLDRIGCETCQATFEDVDQPVGELEPLVSRLQASTIIHLRQKR